MNTTPTKKFRKAGTAAILGGTMLAGALFLPAAAGAQETDGDTTEPSLENRLDRREARRAAFVATLEDLGISVDAVQAGKEAGQTLAQIAEAEGVGRADLVDGLVAAAEERLAEAVANGTLTEDEAAEKLAEVEERVTEGVNAEPGERPVRERIKERIGRNDRTRPSDAPADGATDTGLDA